MPNFLGKKLGKLLRRTPKNEDKKGDKKAKGFPKELKSPLGKKDRKPSTSFPSSPLNVVGRGKKDHKSTPTSFPSPSHSAEIRTRLSGPETGETPLSVLSPTAANLNVNLSASKDVNKHAMHHPGPRSPQEEQAPQQRQFLYKSEKSPKQHLQQGGGFGSSDDDSENQANYANRLHQLGPSGPGGMHQQFKQQHQLLGGLGFPGQVSSHQSGPQTYLTQTPASSSEFCLSTDVEDDEYNRVKHQMMENALMKATSESTEEDSCLFAGLPQKTFSADEDFFQGDGKDASRPQDSGSAGLLSPTGREDGGLWSSSPSPASAGPGGKQGNHTQTHNKTNHSNLRSLTSPHAGNEPVGVHQLTSPDHSGAYTFSEPRTGRSSKKQQNNATGLYPDSSDSEFEAEEENYEAPLAGESCLSSPASAGGGTSQGQQLRKKGNQRKGSGTTSAPANAGGLHVQTDNSLASPNARKIRINDRANTTHSSSVTPHSTKASSAGFQDFVKGEWPASPSVRDSAGGDGGASSRARKSPNNYVSITSDLSSPEKKRRGGGASVSSAPLMDSRTARASRSAARNGRGGSRSVAPPTAANRRLAEQQPLDHFSPRGTSRILDKLERDLKERQARAGVSGDFGAVGNNEDLASSRISARSPSVHKTKRKVRRRREKDSAVSPLMGQGRNEGDGDESSSEEENHWLFDEVTDTLGPRGVAADMESLSGRSNRSKTSVGNKSHRSTRSHRSHKSHKSRKGQRVSSGASVGSRTSHYSHRSARSHMSEASRSVANDLLRLEMQLAMVGAEKKEGNDEVGAAGAPSGGSVSGFGGNGQHIGSSHRYGHGGGSVSGSVGGASRASRTSRSSRAPGARGMGGVRPITPRNRSTVVAPAGKLGLILANKGDGKGTVVSGVRPTSPLVDKILPGDRIVAVDGEDVSLMNVSELTTIMTRKGDFERTLTVISPPKVRESAAPTGPIRSPDFHGVGAGPHVGSPMSNSHYSYRSR